MYIIGEQSKYMLRGLVVSPPLIINMTLIVNISTFLKLCITIYGMVFSVACWSAWDDRFMF